MNLSVLVGSCDRYSPLWENFQICFDKYWDFDTDNYIVTEKKEVLIYTNTKFITVKGIKDPWATRMLIGLDKIQSDFVFFILDDYFIHYKFTIDQMNTWISDMERYQINRLQISSSGLQSYTKINDIPYDQISPKSNYLISMQPSLWRKSFLLETLDPTYSPWDFELKGSRALQGIETKSFIDVPSKNIYFNAVRKGFKKSKGWDDFRIKENLKDFNCI